MMVLVRFEETTDREKWSIVDEDTLKLTDFYGETRTYPITAVDDNSLELELPNGETVTYYHTAEEALKH